MKKVQDIETPGIAYSRVTWGGSPYEAYQAFLAWVQETPSEEVKKRYKNRLNRVEWMEEYRQREEKNMLIRLENILKTGIVNQFSVDTLASSQAYRKQIKNRLIEVYFNIVGRRGIDFRVVGDDSPFDRKGERSTEIGSSWYMIEHGSDVGILFDQSGYTEVPALQDIPRKRQFAINDPDIRLSDPISLKNPGTEWGFRLPSRIPPRKFSGIVFDFRDSEGRSCMPKELIARAQRLADTQLRAYEHKPKLLVPIYDTQGNLWWPVRKSYEEIRTVISSRK